MHRPHRRSVGFLEAEGRRWACFLVTFRTGLQTWRGHFVFRLSPLEDAVPADRPPPLSGWRERGDLPHATTPYEKPGAAAGTPAGAPFEIEEIRTADIFVEETEGEVERKARALGRPLLSGLLSSVLHTRKLETAGKERIEARVRAVVANRRHRSEREAGSDPISTGRLHSLYESYKLDQIAHLIALLPPQDFSDAVHRVLLRSRVDFNVRDRIQLALLVVETFERLLPLPPFEVWSEDFLRHPEVYHRYAHGLHRAGELD